ncbi:MAG: hypothetical protein AB8H79_01370 [Myxococcota bacterium]
MRLFVLLALIGCSGAPPLTELPKPPAEDVPGEPGKRHQAQVASSAEQLSAQPWSAAWPHAQGSVVATASGRLLAAGGTRPVVESKPCGSEMWVPGAAVLRLPDGEPLSFLKAPMVTAAVVERASWRLADVIGERKGIQPGIETPDPAIHQGIRVRSVLKVRRKGPPWQVVVGERENTVIVALADKEAETLIAGVLLERSDGEPVSLAQVPPADLDGDGEQELVVYGDGPTGGLRAVLRVDLLDGGLSVLSFEERGPVSCP